MTTKDFIFHLFCRVDDAMNCSRNIVALNSLNLNKEGFEFMPISNTHIPFSMYNFIKEKSFNPAHAATAPALI